MPALPADAASSMPSRRSAALLAALPLVVLAFMLLSLDPAGDWPHRTQGPGLTVDEMFNVGQGVRLVRGSLAVVKGEVSLAELFHDGNAPGRTPLIGDYLPDHPPLGRIWLGLWHEFSSIFAPPAADAGPFSVVNARVGSVAAFGLTLLLAGFCAHSWAGGRAALWSMLACIFMPRLFGHAHLAALETILGLTWTAAVVAVAVFWGTDPSGRPPSNKAAAWCGLLLGLLLLTKIQGVLLPVPVVLWSLWNWRLRALRPLAVWGLTGGAVFFLGWPWLWFDPPGHLREYLLRTTDRTTIYNFYLGVRYADVDVPWHYPWTMFLVTVPAMLQLLGALSIWRMLKSLREKPAVETAADRPGNDPPPNRLPHVFPGEWLLLACILFPLCLFSAPGVAVYDGERLFLMVFPLWAILIGRGAATLFDGLRLPSRQGIVLTAAVGLASAAGLLAGPAWLSYYNLFTGGLKGAERLGFEQNYWGDALTRELLQETAARVEPGAEIKCFPILHLSQLRELESQSPILRRNGLRLVPWDGDPRRGTPYVLIFRRRADLPPVLDEYAETFDLLAAVKKQGCVLAALLRTKPDKHAAPVRPN